MRITLSERMNAFRASIFSELAAYKKQKISQGYEIIDLSIGSPDLPPPAFVMDTLATFVKEESKYGYSLSGTDEFLEAVVNYYSTNYRVKLNKETEVLCLMGSQDGLVHFPMVFANPGDIILVPDPGYTAYATGIAMAGAVPYFMPLRKENEFLPDISSIPAHIAERAKIMILNFPGNPVPALATEAFFKEAIAFAQKYDIIILHDFAYSELYYDGHKPISFLSLPGAKEVGVEMSSLSKSFNMAGCRIGYLTGNEEIIKAFASLKSNLDYGVFLPIQKAAAIALQKGASFCEQNRKIYESRRNRLVEGLASIGWTVDSPKASMFVWAEIPKGWTSTDFTYALIDRANVVVTPGQAFGPHGEGFVRIALVQDEEKIRQAIANLAKSGIF
ncbi:LL-diaminopimelate aminotransferase [Bacillus alveayuensis]|jgi:LL-diaminopimelate aminotransferase|uniref:LL-diaminopimelate aminotransferase n=1 Tax=Aeribacillus alveayuensis TaxID=279215 RepID=UPI0005CD14EF|nr:LL-diaminopimelate aminotransferase [Bacillus alveayuensis]